MKRILGIGAVIAGVLLFVSVAVAQNEQEMAFGAYVVNYNTFPSTFLDRNIAKAARVKRSESHGVITLAVRKRIEGRSDKPVKSSVTATATNLIGQISKVKLSEIVEGGAIYYIGDFMITPDETISFTVNVQPEGDELKQEFKFARRF